MDPDLLLNAAALAINNDVLFVFLLVAAALIAERRVEKLKKIALALILAALLAHGAKMVLQIERPCANTASQFSCPSSYSFPSAHTALAFTLTAAFLRRPAYPAYMLFALFVAYTRLYLGVHTFDDIAGGAVVGILSYYFLNQLFEKRIGNYEKDERKEQWRQVLHISVGIVLLAFLLVFGRTLFLFGLFSFIVVASVMINRYTIGKAEWMEWFSKCFERRNVGILGLGAALYGLGILWMAALLQSNSAIAAGIIILGIGDGMSTLVGLRGTHPIPYNRGKTVEGTLAFFLSSLLAYPFIGQLAVVLGAITALVESLPIPVDDNITITLTVCAFLLMV